MNKAVFLDRDGVLNEERGDYSWLEEHLVLGHGVKEGLESLKKAGFLLIVITNQGGIAKGLYSRSEVMACHSWIQSRVGNLIDDIYYSPYHPVRTKSLGRKPGSLLLERAIAKYSIDPGNSYMIGDSQRDIDASTKLGVKGILMNNEPNSDTNNFLEAVDLILN